MTRGLEVYRKAKVAVTHVCVPKHRLRKPRIGYECSREVTPTHVCATKVDPPKVRSPQVSILETGSHQPGIA
jgi:hypothetical protein